jgi:hypothetical protein
VSQPPVTATAYFYLQVIFALKCFDEVDLGVAALGALFLACKVGCVLGLRIHGKFTYQILSISYGYFFRGKHNTACITCVNCLY